MRRPLFLLAAFVYTKRVTVLKCHLFSSIQFALRLLAFRHIHKVLGMDPLPQMNPRLNIRNSRKRRRDNSDGTDGFEGEGKKDKKDYDIF